MTVVRPGGVVHVSGRSFTREELSLHALQSRIEDDQIIPTADQRRQLAPIRKVRNEKTGQDLEDAMQVAYKYFKSGRLANLAPLLPLIFHLNGEPYTLDDHFPFAPMFRTRLPRRQTLITGRQVSKSTTLASQGIARSVTLPYFNTLYVTPLFEMIRRFSSNYVRSFIQQSPVRDMMIDSSCNQSVMQRSFRNLSTMFFSFAMLDANRVRGINASAVSIDESQDMDPDHLPVILETLSASKWGFELYAGTPKTLSGTLQNRWEKSSQAQWHIRCQACNKENIPALDYDLDAMTGPSIVAREVSEAMPGIICAKCQRPLQPRQGGWVHHHPERRPDFSGYHVPQHIMPMHYASPIKWATLLGKRDNEMPYIYYNEVCGESYDAGSRLVTQTELKAASTNRPNTIEFARSIIDEYPSRLMAVDWGGGGQNEVSFTALAVMGMRGDGNVDVLFGERMRITHNYDEEARRILQVMSDLRCQHVAHDFSGAGATREHIMVTAGLPISMILPVSYIRAGSGSIMRWKPPSDATGQRGYYQVDKARSLVLACQLIRHKQLQFFEYDFINADHPGLLHDFLSLTEDRINSRTGTDIFTVIRDELAGPDDFAQAVNIGMCALFYQAQRWPDLASLTNLTLDPETLAKLMPPDASWNY